MCCPASPCPPSLLCPHPRLYLPLMTARQLKPSAKSRSIEEKPLDIESHDIHQRILMNTTSGRAREIRESKMTLQASLCPPAPPVSTGSCHSACWGRGAGGGACGAQQTSTGGSCIARGGLLEGGGRGERLQKSMVENGTAVVMFAPPWLSHSISHLTPRRLPGARQRRGAEEGVKR